MRSLLNRVLLLPSTILAFTLSYAAAAALERRGETNTTSVTPAPLSISPDGNWDGIDGSWSSFTLRIGNPEQTIRVFLSTASYQTWAVLPQGCSSAIDVDTCEYQRGGIYQQNASSTYSPIGIYSFWIEQNLGYNGNANYGRDTLSLGDSGDNGPTVGNATVGGFAVDDFYLGVLGVNPKVTNWTSYNDWTPSLLTQLKEQKSIPSVSFGYTAGARYRSSDGIPASLTLGGYDASKFLQNDVQFTMAADNDRDLVVAIQSISTASQIESSPNPTELLQNPVYAYIDSTVPQIWLPLEACQAFEREFGLVYNNQSELYIVNDTLHDKLVERNASVTFTLGQTFDDGPTVQITLPYSAFDLTASSPYYGLAENTTYFPLRRAANDTQYTLGRTFLQEAYLTVDWEGSRFNVSQVSWDQSAAERIVAIPPFSEQQANWAGNGGGKNKGSSLSAGAIAGVVVGIVAFIAIIVGLLIWHIRRNRQYKAAAARFNEKSNDSRPQSSSGNSSTTALNSSNRNSQRPGQHVTVLPKAELEGSSAHGAAESASTPIYEMPGDMPEIREKDGRLLSEKEALAHREKLYNGVDTSPATAAAFARSSPGNSPIDLTSSPESAVSQSPAAPTSSARTPIADMFTRPFRNAGPRNWSLPRRVSPADVVPVTSASAGKRRELAQSRQQQQQQQQHERHQPQGTQTLAPTQSNSTTASAGGSGPTGTRRQSSWSVTRARPFSFEDQRKAEGDEEPKPAA
ncbi:acid protease [Polychaeton citri CBS 116435]|uniref:Acid protease n=1 Tax=Polychaeton citri CBS 116435 TaxID=1314669 RepID=A0A9P4Q7A4_9PEZI|nr:acid protease [Polychaeton citri CBS 116435]